MRVFVITNFLLLLGNVHCDLDCLTSITNGTVQFKGVLWLLRDVVSLSHQVVNQFMSQSVHLSLSNHINHVLNAALTLLNV